MAENEAAPSNKSQRALDWLNFFIADVETAFGPFVAVYLIANGWSQGMIGLLGDFAAIAACDVAVIFFFMPETMPEEFQPAPQQR